MPPIAVRQQPARSRRSLAPSLRHSGVGSAQEPAIQFAMLKYCLSALAVIRVSVLVWRLRITFLSFACRRMRMTGFTAGRCVLASHCGHTRPVPNSDRLESASVIASSPELHCRAASVDSSRNSEALNRYDRHSRLIVCQVTPYSSLCLDRTSMRHNSDKPEWTWAHL